MALKRPGQSLTTGVAYGILAMDRSENFVCQLIKTLKENGDKTCLVSAVK